MTPPNIFFRPILPKFEEIFEIVVGDFERWPMLPVRKTDLDWIVGPEYSLGRYIFGDHN